MEKQVICMFNLFDLHQNIMVSDGNDVRVAGISDLTDLGSNIAMIAEKENINKVHIYGSATYADNILKNIVETNATKYGNRVLDVEIN